MQYLLLRDLAIIFAGSLLVILVFHRLKLPALPGFIVAGVLLGPNALGLVSDVRRVEGLAEVGVVLLPFTIEFELAAGDVLVIVGQPRQLEAARELADGQGGGGAVAAPRH